MYTNSLNVPGQMFGDERMIVIYVQLNTSPLPFAFLGLSEWYQIMPVTVKKTKAVEIRFYVQI